jgi:uncharacterized protein (TIGR03067 family)
MRLIIAVLIAALMPVAGIWGADDKAKKKEAAKTDLAALQGTWVIVEKEFRGKKATKEEIASLRGEMVIKDGTATQWREESGEKEIVSEAKITLDPTARPKSVDIAHTKGDLKGETVLAIYELKGDSLKVCFPVEDEKRPKTFAGEKDGKACLLVYKRVKK